MPNRPQGKSKPRSATFRARYDDLEKRRDELMARLVLLAQNIAPHPALGRARTLLNSTFRKSSLVQRAAVLQAADWLITMIDRSQTML
jgi:hypothetical protein